ncbi:MAG: hypothetical protein OEL83_20820 [Desulforhopalus sp.]|nr:hypothetical protein [Desulforhopalus sp.]
MKKISLIVLLLMCMVRPAWADDTDIYGVSNISVKPNVLIIFDNSGSMGTEDVPGDIYDWQTDYSYAGGRPRYNVYRERDGNFNTLYFANLDSDAKWQCAAAKTALLSDGYWIGNIQVNSTTGVVTCGGTRQRTLRLGNFQNFDDQDLGANKSRIEVAKKVIAKLIYDNADKVRFGLMKFNAKTPSSYYGAANCNTELAAGDKCHEGGYIIAGCGASTTDLIGSFDPATTVFTNSDQSANFGAIGGMQASTYTPLGETMAEAGRYFAGQTSWYNGGTIGTGFPFGKFLSTCAASGTGCRDYSSDSPIQYRCQKSYIIFMTDGAPTQDYNPKLKDNQYINSIKIPAAGKDGAHDYLDDVAYFLAHNDLLKTGSNPSASELLKKGQPGDFEDQTVTTYTIGFKQQLALLQNAATNGGGKYYTADDTSTLSEALNNIITDIQGDSESFTAAAVPISRANKIFAGNFIYYGLFQPKNNKNWVGNVKKYGITNQGVIVDKYGNEAVSGGVLQGNAVSYWSSSADGPAIQKGGSGGKLFDDLEAGFVRKIYTYTGSSNNLTDSTNSFSPGNTALAAINPGLTSQVIGDIRHDNDSEWPYGSFLHSQPLVVHYDDNGDGTDDHSMIYIGGNGGMLHAIDDNDGSEKWGFIPPDLLGDINQLPGATSLQYYVDNSPVLYSYDHDNNKNTAKKKITIFGERRGGTVYTALDISDYNTPLLKYQIKNDILGGGNKVLGLSWGEPKPVTIGYMDGTTYKTKDVFVMAGGYDTNQDNATPAATDDEGRAIYAIDALTGLLQSNINFNVDNFASMTHSIVAVAPFENPQTRTTTRIYAGDMNGNMFAFRDDIFHRNLDKTKDSLLGGYDGKEDGDWGQKLKLFSSPGKKIFYPPNIVNVYFPVSFTYPAGEIDPVADVVQTTKRVGDYVFYGTGDREHPEDITVLNEFYAIKNNWQWNDNVDTASIDESINPEIVKAYIDVLDLGKIKSKADNTVIVDRDLDGKIVASSTTKNFILDITDNLYQNQESDINKQMLFKNYVIDAINHARNKGWFLRFVEADGSQTGEKIVSSPVIYAGVVYFTTYIPEQATAGNSGDPCDNPGARGKGKFYALGARFGEAVFSNFNNAGPDNVPVKEDRSTDLKGKGIPPTVVLALHENQINPIINVGLEIFETAPSEPLVRDYWRLLNR